MKPLADTSLDQHEQLRIGEGQFDGHGNRPVSRAAQAAAAKLIAFVNAQGVRQ